MHCIAGYNRICFAWNSGGGIVAPGSIYAEAGRNLAPVNAAPCGCAQGSNCTQASDDGTSQFNCAEYASEYNWAKRESSGDNSPEYEFAQRQPAGNDASQRHVPFGEPCRSKFGVRKSSLSQFAFRKSSFHEFTFRQQAFGQSSFRQYIDSES